LIDWLKMAGRPFSAGPSSGRFWHAGKSVVFAGGKRAKTQVD
jgi:hypothetical protein